MIAILSFPFGLSLVACSEYNIVPEKADEPTALTTSNSDVPADEPENEEEADTGDTESTDTATTEEPSNCFGYEIEVVGSDYLEPGLWCLPARPYFNIVGEEVVESNVDVQEMTWIIEIDASPEADIEMDVIAVDFDAIFNNIDWFEELNESENWRWSAVTDSGDALIAQPVLTSDSWLALVIMEPNAGWEPAVVVPSGESRQIEITLDTTGMNFSAGDSMTASFDNYQTWETGNGVVPRICTSHEEFPLLGTTYEITE